MKVDIIIGRQQNPAVSFDEMGQTEGVYQLAGSVGNRTRLLVCKNDKYDKAILYLCGSVLEVAERDCWENKKFIKTNESVTITIE